MRESLLDIRNWMIIPMRLAIDNDWYYISYKGDYGFTAVIIQKNKKILCLNDMFKKAFFTDEQCKRKHSRQELLFDSLDELNWDYEVKDFNSAYDAIQSCAASSIREKEHVDNFLRKTLIEIRHSQIFIKNDLNLLGK